jgi:pimeloyl-ACP methyl ester carboxylesterase
VGDVILVHGTTQAAVGWQRLIQELTRRDHRAVAVDLHGAEPSSSIAELAGLCRSQVPADVESPVVVAHSGSGILLPAIAQLVDALHEVYLAAAVPDPTGQLSFLDEMQADPAAMFNPEWLESTQLPIPSWQPTSCSTTATSPPCDGLWGHCDCFRAPRWLRRGASPTRSIGTPEHGRRSDQGPYVATGVHGRSCSSTPGYRPSRVKRRPLPSRFASRPGCRPA